jgi:hypothetical protein
VLRKEDSEKVDLEGAAGIVNLTVEVSKWQGFRVAVTLAVCRLQREFR